MTHVLVPPIKIQGKKTKLVPFIQQHINFGKDATWFEPFMGSGVVGFNVMPHRAVFADTNCHIIEFYQHIKSGKITASIAKSFLEREGRLLEKTQGQHYYTVRSRFNQSHNPLDFLFLNRSCFNGLIRFNSVNAFNVPFCQKPQRFSKTYISKIVNQISDISDLLRIHKWDFKCQSFAETIAMAKAGDFIYCDPPYIGRNVDYYDSWDEQLEIQLHEALARSKARFMMSTWVHDKTKENTYLKTVWKNCHVITKDHYYFVGPKIENRFPVVEALLTNYSTASKQGQKLSPMANTVSPRLKGCRD